MAITSTTLSLATSSSIYTSSGNTVVSVMYFCNQGATAANLNVWVTSAGSTFGSANLIYREVQLAVSDTFVVDMEKLVLANGDYISANTGGTVAATVSYVGI